MDILTHTFFLSCGKTTICQMFAALAGHKCFSVNCHLHLETSDFLGGLRPVRHAGQVTGQFFKEISIGKVTQCQITLLLRTVTKYSFPLLSKKKLKIMVIFQDVTYTVEMTDFE